MALLHSQLLEEGLQNYDRLSTEAVTLLTSLESKLARLTALNKPIYERGSVLTFAEQHIATAKTATDELMQHLDTSRRVEAVLRAGPSHDLDTFLSSLARLNGAVAYLEVHSELASAQEAFSHAEKVMKGAMRGCETDFLSVLGKQSSVLMPSQSTLVAAATEKLEESSKVSVLEPMAPKALHRLQRLAEVMVSAGHMRCIDEYAKVREGVVERSLRLTGFEPSSSAALQLQSQEQLDKGAASWATQLRVLVVLACAELHLARSIWPAHVAHMAFADSITGPARLLLEQGHNIASTRNTGQKIFAVLEMVQQLDVVLPLMRGMTSFTDRCKGLLSELEVLRSDLGKAARLVFSEFEASVVKDASKAQVVDGTVHPLSAHTLSYLRRLFAFPNVESIVLGAGAGGGRGKRRKKSKRRLPGESDDSNSDGPTPADSPEVEAGNFGGAVSQVLSSLLSNLESKARAYKSAALGALFMINNTAYVVSTVEQSEHLSPLLGPSWVEGLRQEMKEHAERYHSLTWGHLESRLQEALDGEDPEPVDDGKWKEWIKGHFKAVNTAVEAIYTSQTGWTVPDRATRKALRQTISKGFLALYSEFYSKYQAADFTSTRSKYIRYSPSDLQSMLQELFEGRPMTLSQVVKPKGPASAGAGKKTVPMVPEDDE